MGDVRGLFINLFAVLFLFSFVFSAEAYAGSITGRVISDADDSPLANVYVIVCDDSLSSCRNGYTLADGSYEITGLITDSYSVEAVPNRPYIAEHYDNTYDPLIATLVSVTEGNETSNINFGLATGGSISGQLTSDIDETPLGDIRVSACNVSTERCESATTLSDGTYLISSIPSGNYRVEASPDSLLGSPYLREYYDNNPDYLNATLVSVTSGITTLNINFGLAVGGSITGQVISDADGSPLGNVFINVCEDSSGFCNTTSTQSDGHYEITGLPTGNYRMEAWPNEPYLKEIYDNSFDYSNVTLVPVTQGSTAESINFGLTVAGRISGFVFAEADGLPLSGISLQACDEDYLNCSSSSSLADGSYALTSLPEGNYWVTAYSSANYAQELYDNVFNFQNKTLVTVSLGAETKNINFSLVFGGTISGTITDDIDGSPLVNVNVQALEIGGTPTTFTAYTEIDGSYEISQLPPGSFRVAAYSQEFTNEFYDNVTNPEEANLVLVSLGEAISDINFGLSKGGSISGNVTEELDSTPLAGVSVNACDDSIGHCEGIITQADGTYRISGLPTGNYRVVINQQLPYMREYYNNVVEYSKATLVPVTQGSETANINFGLAIGGSITGVVSSDLEGTPLAGVWLTACDDSIGHCEGTTTQADGTYRISGLPTGNYLLEVNPSDIYLHEYYDNAYDYSNLTLVSVTQGYETNNIDFGLAQNIDTDGDGVLDVSDLNPTTLNANIAEFSILHHTSEINAPRALLGFAVNVPQDGLNGLSATITGPNFNYTLQDSDVDGGGFWRYYDNLDPGVYTLTITDSLGNSVSRSDSYTGLAVTPLVDTSKVRYTRVVDPTGNSAYDKYLFHWPTVNAQYSYYYRLLILNSDGQVIYTTDRTQNNSTYVPASTLDNSSTDYYRYQIEVCDRDFFEFIFNRSRTNAVAFTANQGNVEGFLPGAVVYNRYEADGTKKIVVSTGLPKEIDISNISLVEVFGPSGKSFELNLPVGENPGDYVVFEHSIVHHFVSGEVIAPSLTGTYTFHAVINGADYYSDATLTPSIEYALPESRSWKVQDLGNGDYFFTWADINYNGYLYYRIMFLNEDGDYWTNSRKHSNSARININNVRAVLGEGPLKWRVEVHDSSSYASLRNRRNGPWVPFDVTNVPLYDPSRTLISRRFNNRLFANGSSELRHLADILDFSKVLSFKVTGPEGYSRDLKLDADIYLGLDYLAYQLIEKGDASPGLYAYELTDVNGTAYEYDTLTSPDSIPVVDYKTVHVNQLANGNLQISWAPVFHNSPLWYNVIVKSLTDHNQDGFPDEIYPFWNQAAAYVEIPNSLTEEPLFITVQARDASTGPLENNRSVSVNIGYEGPGFDYSTLVDEDNDGWANNIDPDDNNPRLYPFVPEDVDSDGDGVFDTADNCPDAANTDQIDTDGDGYGNVCDYDDDGDGYDDVLDAFPLDPNEWADSDNDAIGDNSDACPLDFYNDSDLDGICGNDDNCPAIANSDQVDSDKDGFGDACDGLLPPASIKVPSSDEDGNYYVSWRASKSDGVTYVLEEAIDSIFEKNVQTVYKGTELGTKVTNYVEGLTYHYRIKSIKTGYVASDWEVARNGCYIGTSSEKPPKGGGDDDTGGSEGNGKTCRDGLDNDGDSLVDCADPDCSSSKSCK